MWGKKNWEKIVTGDLMYGLKHILHHIYEKIGSWTKNKQVEISALLDNP